MNPPHAPLVASSADEAADLMVSEGAPIKWPEAQAPAGEACCAWDSGLRTFANRHPLTTLLVAFGVGLAAGLSTPHR